MTMPEIEPASTAWDEHKPLVRVVAPDKAGLTFARVCFWIAAGTVVALLVVIATTIATDALPDEFGFGLWSFGGALSLADLLTAGILMIVHFRRHSPAFRASAWTLAIAGGSLAAHIGTGMYVLSTLRFC